MKIVSFVRNLSNQILQVVLSISLIMVSSLVPLYFENGFTTIGTDKHSIFKFVGTTTVYMVAVLLIFVAVSELVLYYKYHALEGKTPWWTKQIRMSHTDWFLLGYGAVVFLSYLFSEFKREALWGTDHWFMGLIPQLLFLAYYFLYSRLWKRVDWIFYVFLGASSISFVLGILNRYGIYPIDMNSNNPSYISTIGNINWFCGWWAACIFLGILFFYSIRKKNFAHRKHPMLSYVGLWVLSFLYVTMGLCIGLIQGSDSGYLGLCVGLILLFVFSLKEGDNLEKFLEIILLICGISQLLRGINFFFPGEITKVSAPLHFLMDGNITLILGIFCIISLVILRYFEKRNAYMGEKIYKIGLCFVGILLLGFVVFLSLIILNTLHPGAIGELSKFSVFTFDSSWGSSRGATWISGLWGFASLDLGHKFIGAGPDCMSAFIASGANQELSEYVDACFHGQRLTNAHGEWITVLINTGILGLFTYVMAIVTGVYRFIKHRNFHWFIWAAGLCLVCYTVNNIFSFQTTINGSAIFLIWGVAEGILREKQENTLTK